MVMEMLSGKAAAITGELQDATAFQRDGEDIVTELQEKLREHGYTPTGSEVMVNGMSGRVLEASIFTGMGYYQRLKHMVSDKQHARSKGNVQMLSRQPCSGRSREGGERLPQWCVKALLVCLISCNTIKLQGSLKVGLMKSMKYSLLTLFGNVQRVLGKTQERHNVNTC
jgi:hypothetical protein